MAGFDLFESLKLLLILLPSLTFHEWAHAMSASWLGDDTARRMGRCTLNPAAHADPIGTILFPLLGMPFGWAKPVPVNPFMFRTGIRPRFGMMVTALAGPAANVILALLAATALYLGQTFHLWHRIGFSALQIVVSIMQLNLFLAFFNLLPIPPLDGSRVADYLMPQHFRPTWNRIYSSGPIALIGLFVLIRYSPIDLFALPRGVTLSILRWAGIAP